MSEENKNIKSNQLIFGKYEIYENIGQGSFGKVYSGINIKTLESVAIKLEPKESDLGLLKSEALYLFMLNGVGIPKLHAFGKNNKYNILVETLLSKNLSKIFEEYNKKIPLKDSLMIAIQIIERLEYLHSKLLIHRDIKLENFLIGYDDPYIIYLIDFGFCQKYRSNRTGNHVKFSSTNIFIGTMFYGSINLLKGNQPSRRDDLESAAYTIIFLLKGSLPWESTKAKTKKELIKKIYRIKISITPEELCKGLPNEIKEFYLYCRNLDFEQEPNYKYCYSLFNNALIKNGFSNDLIFSWIKDPKILYKLKNKRQNIHCSSLTNRKSNPRERIYNSLRNTLEKKKNNQKPLNSHEIYKPYNNQYKRKAGLINIIQSTNNSLGDSLINDKINSSKDKIKSLDKIDINKISPKINIPNVLKIERNGCFGENLLKKFSSYRIEPNNFSIYKNMSRNEKKKKRSIKINTIISNQNKRLKLQNNFLGKIIKEKVGENTIDEKVVHTINNTNNNIFKNNNYSSNNQSSNINNTISNISSINKSNFFNMNNNINNRGISMDINFNQKNEINTTDRNKLNYKKIIVNKKLSIPFNHKAETTLNILININF